MWTMNISSIIYTRIKYYVESKVKAKCPGLYITNSDVRPSEPSFPTVYIHEMPGYENGENFEGKTINSISSSFQIEVTDASSEVAARNVMNEVVNCMKSMMFSVIAFPEFQNVDGYFRCVARFGRTIGKDDIL